MRSLFTKPSLNTVVLKLCARLVRISVLNSLKPYEDRVTRYGNRRWELAFVVGWGCVLHT